MKIEMYNYRDYGITIDDLDTCHDVVRFTIANEENIDDDMILSFSNRRKVVFIDRESILRIYKSIPQKERRRLDWLEWDKQYADLIVHKIANELYGKKHDFSYFNHIIDACWEDYDNQNNEPWRLPTVSELQAMYNKESGNKVSGFLDDYYWSSTEDLKNEHFVWAVHLGDGYSDRGEKDGNLNVRCVRSNGKGGLELARQSDDTMNWEDAITYAKNIRHVRQKDILTVKLNEHTYVDYK